MLKVIGGIIAGLVTIFVSVSLIQWIGHQAFPISGEVNLRDPAANPTLVTSAPLGAQLFVVGAWFVGALLGGLVAGRVSGRHWQVWAMACFVVLAALGNIFMIPHPTWMQIGAVAAPLLGGFVASRMVPPGTARQSGSDADAV